MGGGFIDMAILSEYLGVQICSVCVRSLRVDFFPNEPQTDARIFLLYDGIHYDCVLARNAKDQNNLSASVFSPTDEMALNKAVAVALDLQEKKQFTDTANFTLQCQHCWTKLKGEKDAQEHGKATGHFNFQECNG